MKANEIIIELMSSMWVWFQAYAGGPLLVGLLVAYVIPRSNQVFQGRREHLSKAVDTLRIQIDALRRVTTLYWLNDFDRDLSPEHEGEIEFLLQDISGLVAVCVPYLWKREKARGPELVASLMAATTGGGFGTRNRKAQPNRVQRIAIVAAEISKEVVKERSRFLS